MDAGNRRTRLHFTVDNTAIYSFLRLQEQEQIKQALKDSGFL